MVARQSPPGVFAGRYELQEEVGRGSQGAVWRALDRGTGETVALKRWRGSASPAVRAAFEVDMCTIAGLADPCVVGHRSMGATLDGLFLAMEWVPGGTLADRLARGRLSPLEALDVMKQVARGVARLHRAGLVHRNISPVNVLLFEGSLWRAKISDLLVGVEELPSVELDLARLEDTVGYLSLRAIRHGRMNAGPREDVYSIGAILFRCLAGCRWSPEDGGRDPSESAARPSPGGDLAIFAPPLPKDLYDLVDRMLSDDPSRCPADAVEPCLALYDLARRLGSYDKITEVDLAPSAGALPPRFEVREARPAPDAPSVEPEIEVDPGALRGPFVILDPPLDGGETPPSPHEIHLREGDLFAGRFLIEEIAGAGSTGVVHRAKDRETRDTVALRIIDGAASRREIRRFLGDCAKHAQRYHPRIVRLLHRGAVAGRMFVAMDWIGGETLEARLAREPLTLRDAVTVIRGILEALELVHTMGLVQGNLSPRNVFLRNRNVEWVKLSDIAVWRAAPSLPEGRADDLAFVAPEAARTGRTSQRADVYSLGAIAYRLVAGVLPFDAADAEELATRRWAPAQPLAELRPEVGPALCRFVDSLLPRDPSRRPQSAVVAAGRLESKEDLGWGAELPPHPIARSEDGERTGSPPDRGPFDPFQDARYQGFLAAELTRHREGAASSRRFTEIAHARAVAPEGSPPCALCGQGPSAERRFVEVRRDGYCPLEYKESFRARQPVVCSECLVAPFADVDAAVRRTLASYRGDDLRRVAVLGPTRGEVRDAIEALYARAVPRMKVGKCLVCGKLEQVVEGRGAAMCPACLSAARMEYEKWVTDAPNRRSERLVRALDEIYASAVVRVRRRPFDDVAKRTYPPRDRRHGPHGYNFYQGMIDLRAAARPTAPQIDAVAEGFAAALLEDAARAMRDIPEVGAAATSTGAWNMLHLVEELRSRYRPGPAADEQLRIALAVVDEAKHRGARLYEPEEGIETIGG
jgi:serine/threonine protein kinase